MGHALGVLLLLFLWGDWAECLVGESIHQCLPDRHVVFVVTDVLLLQSCRQESCVTCCGSQQVLIFVKTLVLLTLTDLSA